MVKEFRNKIRSQRIAKCLELSAFTLLELLLVIAIISVLAGIIMFSLKPADRLREANQTKYLSNANDLEKAFNSYVVDNGGNLPASFNSLTYGYYDICRQGQSGSCVSLDELVTSGKMSSIPVDSDKLTATTTGFRVKYDPVRKEAIVYSNTEYTSRVNSGTTLTEGLVGWWKMDEASWNGTVGEVKDSSGKNYNGTSINGTVISTAGKYSNGGKFDGIDDYLNMGTQVSALSEDATVAIWVKTSASGTLITNRDNNLNAGNWYSLNATSLEIGSPYYGVSFVKNIRDNVWHHVLFTKSGTLFKVYIDGVLDTTRNQSSTINHIGKNTFIGKHWTSPTGYNISGIIDDTRIYNRALNLDEVMALYEYAPPPIAHWKFDEGAGTTGKDFSSQNPDLTFAGTPTWTNDCKVSNCINFDTDQTDYASFTVPGNSPFNMGAQDFSVSSWVKIPQPTTYGSGVFGRYPHNTSYNGNWVIGILDDRVTYFFGHRNTTGTIAFWSGINFSSYFGKWTHSEWVKSGSNMYLFINGVQVSSWVLTNPFDITFSGVPFYFSNTSWSPGEMNGLVIDEFKLYNYARSQAQVVKDMNNN